MKQETKMFLKMPPETKTIKVGSRMKGMLTEIKNAEKELKLVKKWYEKSKDKESEKELEHSRKKYQKKIEDFVKYWNYQVGK